MTDFPAWEQADRQALICDPARPCVGDHTCANHVLLAMLHEQIRVAVGLWALIEEAVFEANDIDGSDVWDMALGLGLVAKHPEPYDPERHGDIDIIEPGDPWYTPTPLAQALARKRQGDR